MVIRLRLCMKGVHPPPLPPSSPHPASLLVSRPLPYFPLLETSPAAHAVIRFWTKPETAADAEGEGGGRGREEGRWKSARASIGVVTEVAANVGSGARARARHFVCSDLRWAAGVVGSVAPGGFGGGFDGVFDGGVCWCT